MVGPRFDVIEREQLADLFDELGADAPTLLQPWTTRDLVWVRLVWSEAPTRVTTSA